MSSEEERGSVDWETEEDFQKEARLEFSPERPR